MGSSSSHSSGRDVSGLSINPVPTHNKNLDHPSQLVPDASVTTIHVEPRSAALAGHCTHAFAEIPCRQESIHIEEVLNYEDRDHQLAHGHGPDPDEFSLQRNRTLSIVSVSIHSVGTSEILISLTPIQATPDEKEFGRRRRRSHDEKVVAKARKFLIDVKETQRMILAQEETDGDFQITVQDTGPETFQLDTANASGYRKYEIRGTYILSNLLQELALAADYGRKFIVLDEDRLNEDPLDRLSRLIKFHFWDGLTRRVDAEGLEVICNDPKNRSHDQQPRLYAPFHDQLAFDYYNEVAAARSHLNLDVVRLPEIISPRYVKSLNQHPGILSLALRKTKDSKTGKDTIRGTPFVVPSGRFNEMYGWNSYFEALGLLVDGRIELACGMVENFNYEIEHYGRILNANRSYYLTRSQPPFLTDMIAQVARSLPSKGTWTPAALKIWNAQGYRASIKELLSVWMAAPRLDPVVGLCKFHPEGIGMPPETEASHFNHILERYAEKAGIPLEEYMRMYAEDEIQESELDAYFVHDRAVRESGHDTTYRYEKRCANLATIDLNSLVYKYDMDLARVTVEKFGGCIKVQGKNHFTVWFYPELFSQLATRMRALIDQYFWNPSAGLYYDYDCAEMEQSVYETATCLWALWAECATQEQADIMVPRVLELFEVFGGLVSGTEDSRGQIGLDRPNHQWDYPQGWAPHQILAWPALTKYGYAEEARRIAYRWMYTITKSFVDFNGVVPEKFDVVALTHKVNMEYRNVGADVRFVVRERSGWMIASFQLGVQYLTKNMRRALGTLTPPEQLFCRVEDSPAQKMVYHPTAAAAEAAAAVMHHSQHPVQHQQQQQSWNH
ncbi:trehalase-domain-containing protein [Phlyctochytrium arcticum]|nr:trehalase-domain-containing protein [Phlyctochytrium arcticum]